MVSRFSSFTLYFCLLTVVLLGNALSGLVRVADDSRQSPYRIPLAECFEEEGTGDDGSDDFLVLFDTSSARIAESLQKTSIELSDTVEILIALHGLDSSRAPPIITA